MELGAGNMLELPTSWGHFRTGTTLAVLKEPALIHFQESTSGVYGVRQTDQSTRVPTAQGKAEPSEEQAVAWG